MTGWLFPSSTPLSYLSSLFLCIQNDEMKANVTCIVLFSPKTEHTSIDSPIRDCYACCPADNLKEFATIRRVCSTTIFCLNAWCAGTEERQVLSEEPDLDGRAKIFGFFSSTGSKFFEERALDDEASGVRQLRIDLFAQTHLRLVCPPFLSSFLAQPKNCLTSM